MTHPHLPSAAAVPSCGMRFAALLALLLLPSLSAQPSALPGTSAPASSAPAGPASAGAIEQQVGDLLKQPGATVVHLWATWCPNCGREFKDGGWQNFVEANPQTRFVFVTFWNDGNDGKAQLTAAGIGAQPNVTVLAHPGPRKGDAKPTSFLGTPVTWLPSTWIFDKGKLKFALNYGEVRFGILQQLLEDAQAKW